jgi:predicted MFS family arabinose efflux permease
MANTDYPASAKSPALERGRLDPALLWTMTVASGAAVANIYYNQPMLADMMRTFHSTPRSIGLVATFTQIGYALGMPLFVPLGDFVERRRLVVSLFFSVAIALVAAAMAPNLAWIVAASLAIGMTTVIAQILVPLATELASPAQQGKTIGTIQSGVLLGILLARTLSGTVAQHLGWRAMFWIAAALASVFALSLRSQLPTVHPHTSIRYTELMHSIWKMALGIPQLRQVSFVAAMFFASLTAFWTTLVFLLETPPYHYGAQVAGMFGLIGATGVTAAPISGRMSDRHSPRYVVGIAIILVIAAYAAFSAFGFHLWGLILGVVLLDAGVQAAQVANQNRVLQLRPDARNRVNTVYMISYFTGGSIGSALGSWAWNHWQWHGVCATGFAAMILASIAFLFRGPEPARVSS